jgi:hypothetical protein
MAAMLIAGSTRVVEAGGGWWRVRRVRSADLARYELVELVGASAMDAEVKRLQAELRGIRSAGDPAAAEAIEERIREAQGEAAIRRVERDPSLIGKFQSRIDAWVCAGVEAAGEAADDLEPVALVMDAAQQDEAAGRVWVGCLPEDVRGELFAAIEALCEAPLARPFRPGPGDVAPA